jgi:hypothetical protein
VYVFYDGNLTPKYYFDELRTSKFQYDGLFSLDSIPQQEERLFLSVRHILAVTLNSLKLHSLRMNHAVLNRCTINWV